MTFVSFFLSGSVKFHKKLIYRYLLIVLSLWIYNFDVIFWVLTKIFEFIIDIFFSKMTTKIISNDCTEQVHINQIMNSEKKKFQLTQQRFDLLDMRLRLSQTLSSNSSINLKQMCIHGRQFRKS